MLSSEENEDLTAVEVGTPMGDYLRRFWHPVAATGELDAGAIRPLRLLGEEFVLFRSLDGRCGLLDRHCSHRRADLVNGFVDGSGLRCSYHGWCFDVNGACTSRPFEDVTSGSERVREAAGINANPVLEHAGLVWAYLGPAPAPELPNWEPFTYENGFAQIVLSDVPCNWLQCQENSIDPVHFEWLHANWSRSQRGESGYSPTHARIEFEQFDHGFGYHRLLEGETTESVNWQVMRLCLLPNIFLPRTHFEYRVPVDRFSTRSVVWHFTPVPVEAEPYEQKSVPSWTSPVYNPDGSYIKSHVLNQDFVAWIGQGDIADRTLERIGRSDRGVVLLRRALKEGMRAVAEGSDPAGVWGRREPLKVSDRIELPGNRADVTAPRLGREDWIRYFRSQRTRTLKGSDIFWLAAGQPEDVQEEFAQAVGFTVGELTQ